MKCSTIHRSEKALELSNQHFSIFMNLLSFLLIIFAITLFVSKSVSLSLHLFYSPTSLGLKLTSCRLLPFLLPQILEASSQPMNRARRKMERDREAKTFVKKRMPMGNSDYGGEAYAFEL